MPRSQATRARSRSAPGPGIPPTRRRRPRRGWILAVDWVPYQLPTFVTPAFPGFASGSQHVQSGGSRGPDGLHRQRVLPGRRQRLHDQGRLAEVREGPARRTSASSGPRTTTPPTRPASLAPLRRHPHPGGRLHRPDHRLGVRQGRVGARAAATTRARPGRDARPTAASLPSLRRGRQRSVAVVGSRRSWSGRCGVLPARCRPCHAASALGRRASSTRPRPRGSTQTYDGARTYAVGGGVAAFDCNGDGKPDLYRRGWQPSGGAVPQRQPGRRRRCGSRPVRDAATDLADVTGAYPLDIDGDGIDRPGRAARRRDRSAARPRRLPVRAGRTRLVVRRRQRLDHRVQRDLGGRGDAADARVRELPATRRHGTRHATAPTTRWSGRIATGAGLRAADRAHARATARSRCCSATGTAPAGATCGSATTATTTLDGEEQLWRIDAGEPPAPVHRRRRLGPDADLGHGHRQLRRHRRRLSRRVPDQPGRQQAPDADGRAEPADLPRHRRSSAASPPTSRSPAATSLPSTAWHPEFEDVNNDGFIDLFVSKGNVSSRPTTRRSDPSNLLLGQPDGTFIEAADAAGILNYGRGPRRRPGRLQPRRPARPRRGQLRRRRSGSGATSARGTPDAAGADGQLAGVRPTRAGPEPRRHRRLDRGPGRRHDACAAS